MNYYKQGGAAKAEEIKAAFEKLGIDVLDFGFADKTVVYCSIGGCVQFLPYSINLMHILRSHPDYKELPLPVEPLFHAGDWLYHNTLGVHPILVKDYSKRQGYKVECIRTTYYLQKGVVENEYHLWSISDAKDGDVLSTGGIICIFKKLDKDGYYIISPCIYTVKDGLEVINDEDDSIGSCGFRPATKEDRELLFRKMQEAGYEWDSEKKELRKIQPHYDIANFKAGMPVLVRNNIRNKWLYTLFGMYNKDNVAYPFVVVDMRGYAQCIPFNEDTKHLLGTSDMPSEEYINW